MKFPIRTTTTSGLSISIRPPAMADAPGMLTFINALSQEQTYITFQGEQLSLKEELSFIRNMRKKIKNHTAVHLIALDGDKVIASTSIELGIRVNHHVGIFAISIADGYRGEGLGSTLIDQLIQYAKKYLPALKIIELKVFANNPRAQHVYAKHGFQEFGRLPKGVLYKGDYIDEILMYKEL